MSKELSLSYFFSLVKLLFLLTLTYSSIRGVFFYYNQISFDSLSSSIVINSFLHGIRFDVAAILTINTPVILISFLLPFIFINQKSGLRWLQGVFWLFNVPFIIFSFVDLLYYPFTGKRNGLEVFDLWFDIKDQIAYFWSFQYCIEWIVHLYFTIQYISNLHKPYKWRVWLGDTHDTMCFAHSLTGVKVFVQTLKRGWPIQPNGRMMRVK